MQYLKRLKPSILALQNSTANTIYVDSDTNEIKVGSGASGTTERVLVDSASFGTLADDLLPTADNTYDVGSASVQWKSAYIGTSQILAAGATLQFGTATPAVLSRGAADRLDLASGDSLYLVSGGLGVSTAPGNAGTITATGAITTAAASSFHLDTRWFLYAGGATGQAVLSNEAVTAAVGLDVATDAVLKVRTSAHTAYATVDALAYQTGGNAVGYDRTVYAAGTPYALTNTAAAIDVGTTDPAITLNKVGTYLIMGQVNLAYNGATVVAETASIKVRRTNNTAADLSAVVVIDLPVATTLTHTYGVVPIPPFVYTTAVADDAITLFANVSAALGVGTIDATAIGTSLVAIRLY